MPSINQQLQSRMPTWLFSSTPKNAASIATSSAGGIGEGPSTIATTSRTGDLSSSSSTSPAADSGSTTFTARLRNIFNGISRRCSSALETIHTSIASACAKVVTWFSNLRRGNTASDGSITLETNTSPPNELTDAQNSSAAPASISSLTATPFEPNTSTAAVSESAAGAEASVTEGALLATSDPEVMVVGFDPSTGLELEILETSDLWSPTESSSADALSSSLLISKVLSAVKEAEEWGTSRRSPSPSYGNRPQEKVNPRMASQTFAEPSGRNPDQFGSLAFSGAKDARRGDRFSGSFLAEQGLTLIAGSVISEASAILTEEGVNGAAEEKQEDKRLAAASASPSSVKGSTGAEGAAKSKSKQKGNGAGNSH